MYRKIIAFDRYARDFGAYFDGNLIGFFPNYHAAECALNDHALLLCERGLIDTPLAALGEQPLVAADPGDDPIDDRPDQDQTPEPEQEDRACVPDDQPADDFSDVGPERADSAVRTHLRYGHLRRDLFAPVSFCACGLLASIVVYGEPDVYLCSYCHAVNLNDAPADPSAPDGCGLIVAQAGLVAAALVLCAVWRR